MGRDVSMVTSNSQEFWTVLRNTQAQLIKGKTAKPFTSFPCPPPFGVDSALPGRSPWKRFSSVQTPEEVLGPPSAHRNAEGSRFTFSALRPEAILRWPTLRSVVPVELLEIDSFPLSSDHEKPRHGSQGPTTTEGPGIRDEDFIPLCSKFLEQVHPRNPVLDEAELRRQAQTATEYGLQYDSSSCIVLLACALAAYTKPWPKPNDFPIPPSDEQFQTQTVEDLGKAKAYYLAAQKRFGLLGRSIQDIQCLFFAHIFEKSMLRPLEAWFYLQQAATRLEALLLRGGERAWPSFQGPPPKDYHLEQRLFWSCFRSESELFLELGLQPSGLDSFSYPEAFPRLPDELSSPTTNNSTPPSEFPYDQQHINEMGWSYYLAEISARRMIDETLHLWYRKGETYWMKNPTHLIEQYHECQLQVSSWHEHLPPAVQFHDDENPVTQFASALQGRAQIWREYILRPIVYYALHHDRDMSVPSEIRDLSNKAIDLCARMVHRFLFHTRHGGSWFVVRNCFAYSTIIIAAALNPDRIDVPSEWRSLIQTTIRTLKHWGEGAGDVAQMAGTLEFMYYQACVQIDTA
uniref:Xylanolytic transcriptional activator regulatory domain-containing protein n=1 Tax=Bionectria ochroleuca TaxID=29856 RepID=A0A0B7JT75_BIOOC